MKPKVILLCLCLLSMSRSAYAQWVVTDPSNLAQGIVNSTKQVVEAAKNGSTLLQSFQQTVKIYEQSKKYYDALKSVSNLVRTARKVQQSILIVGEISDIYVDGYKRMVSDENFTPAELAALTDKDRIDVVQRVYDTLRRHRDLARYYTRKHISVSLLRAKARNDLDRVLSLYGTDDQRYW